MLIWWVSGFFLIFAPEFKNIIAKKKVSQNKLFFAPAKKAGGIVRSLTFWYNNVL